MEISKGVLCVCAMLWTTTKNERKRVSCVVMIKIHHFKYPSSLSKPSMFYSRTKTFIHYILMILFSSSSLCCTSLTLCFPYLVWIWMHDKCKQCQHIHNSPFKQCSPFVNKMSRIVVIIIIIISLLLFQKLLSSTSIYSIL